MKIRPIPNYDLNSGYFQIHKEKKIEGFGLDNSENLFENGIGLYSSVGVKKEIGPLRTNFYRIGLCVQGNVTVAIGLEEFRHRKNTVHFNKPGDIFSLKDKSDDMFALYLLFTEEYLADAKGELRNVLDFEFFELDGIQFFELNEAESLCTRNLFSQMDVAIKTGSLNQGLIVKKILLLILLNLQNSYYRQGLNHNTILNNNNNLIPYYKKLLAANFKNEKKLEFYSERLHLSTKHLERILREQTNTTHTQFVIQMLLIEIKIQLKFTNKTIASLAEELGFSDASHLSSFFKKHTGKTTKEFRLELK